MLLSAAAIGTFALTLTAVLSSNKIGFMTKATESPYAIADDEYEVATMEQFNNGTSTYGYSIDRPLGNNSIAGHVFGSYEDGVKEKKTYNLQIGVNENLKWKFSGLRAKSETSTRLTSFRLENNSTNLNIQNASAFPEADYPDEYGIGQLMSTHSSVTRSGAMITDRVIKDIRDISLFWRTSYTQKIYICYQLDGETEWKELHSMTDSDIDDGVPMAGNYTGTRGWDAYGYTTFNSSSWTTKELYGKDAKLAIVIGGTISGNLPLSAIMINANKSAVRYLNALSYQDKICSSNGENLYFDLRNTTEDYVHNQALFQLATEKATGEFLAEYNVAGAKTSETTALGLYNHLVGAIPGLGTAK